MTTIQLSENIRHRDSIHPLVVLWELVAQDLQITPKQAAEFVEGLLKAGEVALWWMEERTGLFYPDKPSQRTEASFNINWSRDPSQSKNGILIDIWNSAEGYRWDLNHENMQCWRLELGITKQAAKLIRDFASALRGQGANRDRSPDHLGRLEKTWPWGLHDTKALQDLAAAAERFWSRYDPEDDTTATTNAEVSKWLQTERNVSARIADAIATILRADGLPTGPRT